MTDEPRVKKLLFLVDDDPDFLEIFSAKLGAAGFEVIPFQDGHLAITEAAKKQPDLIILDVQMPKISGPEVLSELKADPQTAKLKVLFLTNAGSNEEGSDWLDQKFAKDAGALAHIRKSDDLSTITDQIIKTIQ